MSSTNHPQDTQSSVLSLGRAKRGPQHSSGPRYCADCGGPLATYQLIAHEPPRQVCDQCGRVWYRNAKPTAGAVVVRDGRALLVRRGVPPALGKWDIPGGFLELAEHPEEGARRELREETGLEITPTGILGLYMERYPFAPPESGEMVLVIYYLATADGTPHPSDDAAEVGWFAPDAFPSAEELAFPHLVGALEDVRRQLTGAS